MSLKPPSQRLGHHFATMTNHEEYPHSYSIDAMDAMSVISETPTCASWTCPQCSYYNGDKNNVACAMCGTKDETQIIKIDKRSKKNLQQASWILPANLQQPINEETQNTSTLKQSKASVPPPAAVNGRNKLTRPRKEEDPEDEAPPTKPTTGRTAYLQSQKNLRFAERHDSNSDVSVASSIATAHSGKSSIATAHSGKQSINSVTSSVKTVKMSNTGPQHSRATVPNSRELTAAWETTPTRSNSGALRPQPFGDNQILPKLGIPEITAAIPSPAYKDPNALPKCYQEQRQSYIPAFMQSSSMVNQRLTTIDDISSAASEQSVCSTSSSSQAKSFAHNSSANSQIFEQEQPVIEPSIRRNDSLASSARVSILSKYEDEISSREMTVPSSMECGQIMDVQEREEGSEELPSIDLSAQAEEDNDAEKSPSRKFILIVVGLVFLIALIVLMVTLIPGGEDSKEQKSGQVTLWFVPTSAPSTLNPVASEEATSPSSLPPIDDPRVPPIYTPGTPQDTVVPSSSPTNDIPTSPSTNIIGLKLLNVFSVEDGYVNVGSTVSIGGSGGDMVAFIGDKSAATARFNVLNNSWSEPSYLKKLFEFQDTAQISLASQSDRLLLSYDGKFEIHQYDQAGEWFLEKFFHFNFADTETLDSPATVGTISGDGMMVAVAHPAIGVQTYLYNQSQGSWILFPFDKPDTASQVELSTDGRVMASLIEGSVKIKKRSAESKIWEDYGKPITDVKKASRISLSGDGLVLAVTNGRSGTALFSLSNVFGADPLYEIDQGGVDISLDYEGKLLALGYAPSNTSTNDKFYAVTMYQRQSEIGSYEYLDEETLSGYEYGASLSLKRDGDHTYLAVGSPNAGRASEGNVKLYQVQPRLEK